MTTPAFQMTYGDLKACNPRHDAMRIRILNALYRGGCHLLGDGVVMDQIFPRHANEKDVSYNARRAFAFYENVFGQSVNYLIAGLAQDPCVFRPKEDEQADDQAPAKKSELDPFWKELMEDATPPGDDVPDATFDSRIRAMGLSAVVTGFGWILCDMPPAQPVSSELEQEEAGLLNAYPVPYNSCDVIDWEIENGRFQWVKTYECCKPASSPAGGRKWTRHEWTIWTDSEIFKYRLELDKDGKDAAGHEWKDEDVVPVMQDYPIGHSFKRVPWVLFDADPGNESSLFLGDVLESIARSMFVQQNAEVFIRLRAHAQQLYEFLGSEIPGIDTPIPENQKDAGRARKGQRRSPDVVEVRGKDDKAEFVAPNMDGVAATQKAIEDMRTAILRVASQLALSQDTQGAMLRRSGDSKAQDKTAEEIILGAVGKKLLSCAKQVASMLAVGRGDKPDTVPDVHGYEAFSVDDTDDVINRLVQLQLVQIESPTFWQWVKTQSAHKIMGDNAPPTLKDQVGEELKKTITMESFQAKHDADLESEKARAEQAKAGPDNGGAPGPQT